MLHDLDETIKAMLVQGVPLDLSEIDVAFEAPTSEWSASLARPTVNCYLYHLIENHDLRSNQWEMDRMLSGSRNGASRKRLPFRLDVCYMITAWANEAEDQHRLLWRVLGALIRHATLPREMLQGALVRHEWPLPAKIAQPEAPIKNPSDFWSSMEGPIRAGFNYTVTLPLDPEMIEQLPLVLTRRVRTKLTPSYPVEESNNVQIGGWVRGGEGESAGGVAGAQVLIVEQGRSVQTDEWGRFAFNLVPRGRYTLRAGIADKTVERTIEVPGEEYDLVLAGAPTITGQTGDTPEAPYDGAGPPPAPEQTPKNRRR